MPNGRKCPYTADIAMSLAISYSNAFPVLKCWTCNSTEHLFRQCPHRSLRPAHNDNNPASAVKRSRFSISPSVSSSDSVHDEEMTPSPSQLGLTLSDFPILSFAFSPNADDPPHSAFPPPVSSPSSSPANVSVDHQG
jgi:hypothetical protein